MRRDLITIAIIVVIALLGGLVAWYYAFGPGLGANVASVRTAVAADKKAQNDADKALAQAAALPDKWEDLKFDDDAEATRIAEDLVASRQYKVDNYRSPAAATAAKDIEAADASLKKEAAKLEKTSSDLRGARKPFLPAAERDRISFALNENEALMAKLKTKRSGLKELKSDNYIWGHLGIVIESDNNIMNALEQAETAMSAGDYVGLQESTASARLHLTDSTDWLQAAEQELINVGIYSKDTAALKSFMSHAGDTTQAYEQAAIFLFGPRADASAFKQAAERASGQLTSLRKIAANQVFSQGYKAWFLARAKGRL
jgi:hypothetical protein